MQASLLCRIAVKNTRPSVFSTQGPFIITTKLNALLRFSCDVGYGPNIIGTVPSGSMIAAYEPTGCFSRGSEVQASYEGGSGANRPLLFDATRSSEIYGLSTTVQPSAMNALVCIKI